MSKRLILAGAAALLLIFSATSVEAQGNWRIGDGGSVRFRLGLFQPHADSSYWDEKFEVWTGDAESFRDVVWGMDTVWMLTPTSGIQFGADWYDGDTYQAYREWVDSDGNEVAHDTELRTWDLTAAWVYRPLTASVVRPYFGIGGGISWWRLTESGRFIDFGGAEPEIFSATYSDEGTAFIAFIEAGIDVYVWDRWTFFVEGRWKHGETTLGGGFADLEQKLDLSGPTLSAGFALLF